MIKIYMKSGAVIDWEFENENDLNEALEKVGNADFTSGDNVKCLGMIIPFCNIDFLRLVN
ncbi:hypothetical protein EXW39_27905 (plasmid) [Bacillus mycoides]|uniref:hypothetical protein n=2 Tax=Bacillus mycoides TaxID=1405 RepID=UPI001C02CD9C|nr:hypothetical protein [Bacillus mycoides]MED1021101.1 hypothetical protein [Bacillus mycoides]QWH63930.1 hypothetical protein EXW39_27905 [Bacillus mycoides]